MSMVAEDLVMLAMNPRKGRVSLRPRYALGCALMVAELARLEATGRIRTVADPRRPAGMKDNLRVIVIEDAGQATGCRELDAALASMAAMEQPAVVWQWLSLAREGIVNDYLERLAADGVIEQRARRWFGRKVLRSRLIDPARIGGARARFRSIACGSGEIGQAEALYAGLAQVMRVAPAASIKSRQARDRLDEISRSQWVVGVTARTIGQHRTAVGARTAK